MKSEAPQYSPDGLIGLSVLYSDWANSIFYFEDANYEAVYERLLKKLIPSLKHFAVACTGGKSIARGVAKRSKEAALPCIVVVDKDYDDILGEYEKNAELGMLYLRRYSLENYIVEIDALIEVAIEELSSIGKVCQYHQLQDKVFDRLEYIARLQELLTEVGKWFVFVQKHGLKTRSSKIAGEEMFAGADPRFPLPEDWFKGYCQQILETIKSGPDWLLEDGLFEQAVSTAFETECRPWGDLSPLDHVVGKHFLFGLLTYIDARLGTSLCTMKSQELYIRVLNHVDLKPLGYLTEEVKTRLHGTSALSL